MQIFATLEADFQGAHEYQQGGIGPLFQQRRLEEPHGLWEMLSRTAIALGSLKVTHLVALFIDDEEIELDDEDPDHPVDEIRPGELADAARRAYGDGDPAGFLLMYTHEEERFSHTISVEASTDHPFDEAGLSVLLRSTPLHTDDELDAIEEEDLEEELSAGVIEGGDPAYEYVDESDPGGELYGAVQQFMREIQSALNRELALDQPEVELWYEEGAAPAPGRDAGPLPGIDLG